MQVTRPALLLFAFLWSAAVNSQQSLSLEERVGILRQTRDQIEATATPNDDLYRRYFDAFPQSFAGLSDVLEILMRPKGTSNFGQEYLIPMCRAYDHVDHRQYMRKLLKIGIEANNWGGIDKDRVKYVYPGDAYVALIYRLPCETLTEESRRQLISIIYELAPEFTDAQIEAIYNSLCWDGEQRSSLDWFLTGLCSRYPGRCDLTRMLHEKYVKHLHADDHPH